MAKAPVRHLRNWRKTVDGQGSRVKPQVCRDGTGMCVMKHAAGGCEAARLIRENVDSGFCMRAAVGSGFIG